MTTPTMEQLQREATDNPLSRRIMAALRDAYPAQYPETENGFDWLCADTTTILEHAPTGDRECIGAALVDAGIIESSELSCRDTTMGIDRIAGVWSVPS